MLTKNDRAWEASILGCPSCCLVAVVLALLVDVCRDFLEGTGTVSRGLTSQGWSHFDKYAMHMAGKQCVHHEFNITLES